MEQKEKLVSKAASAQRKKEGLPAPTGKPSGSRRLETATKVFTTFDDTATPDDLQRANGILTVARRGLA